MSKNKQATTTETQQPVTAKDVSLAPACGVFFIIAGVVFAVGMAVVAVMLIGKQDEMAIQALDNQLIPWIEQSELKDDDKNRIVDKLTEVTSEIRQGAIDDRQLQRIRTRVTQNPILQWAPIQQTLDFAEKSDEFSDAEREQLQRISDRLLQACEAYQFNMEDLGIVLQNLVTQESKSMRLVIKKDITHSDVVTFMQRAEEMLDRREIKLDETKRGRSVSVVFNQMIDEALDVDQKLKY